MVDLPSAESSLKGPWEASGSIFSKYKRNWQPIALDSECGGPQTLKHLVGFESLGGGLQWLQTKTAVDLTYQMY